MAPEAIMNLQFSTKSDVWAFGVTAYEIFIREEPFAETDPVEVAMAVCRRDLKPILPDNFPKELVGIFNKCFETNVDSRPTTTELINALQIYLAPLEPKPMTSKPSSTQYGSVTTASKTNQVPSQYQAFIAKSNSLGNLDH